MEEKKEKVNFSLSKILPKINPLIALLLIFLIILIISLIFDKKIVHFMQDLRNPFLDFILLYFSIASIYLIIIVPSLILYIDDKKNLFKLWLTFALTASAMILIKIVFQRERPFQELDITTPLSLVSASYSLWDFSFPSNHSALSFCSLSFLKGKFFVIWLALALIMSFSRIYFGLHYLSDVIAGIFIGYSISLFIKKKIKC